jgi:hypothetical protein
LLRAHLGRLELGAVLFDDVGGHDGVGSVGGKKKRGGGRKVWSSVKQRAASLLLPFFSTPPPSTPPSFFFSHNLFHLTSTKHGSRRHRQDRC